MSVIPEGDPAVTTPPDRSAFKKPKTARKSKKPGGALPKLIDQYYADLKDLAHQNVMYEMGTRPAFHALLQAVGKEHKWTLIAEHEKKVNGKTIRPDGTFKDEMNLVRGYWEAKDTSDKLDAEIEKKRKLGYPLTNIIFEDTATAVLYQHGGRILTADMKDVPEACVRRHCSSSFSASPWLSCMTSTGTGCSPGSSWS